MTSQTFSDLVHMKEIIAQRIHELSYDKSSVMQEVCESDAPTIFERVSLGFLHWFVKILTE
jgi:hypothetical protein